MLVRAQNLNYVIGFTLIGLAGVAMVASYQPNLMMTPEPPVVAEEQIYTAVVARETILRGNIVDARDLATIEVRGRPLPNVAQTPNEIQGAFALDTIHPGQVVGSFNAVRDPSAHGALSMLVPEGMRAVALRITDDVAVGNYLRPKDRVDVLLRITPEETADAETARGRGPSAITTERQSNLLLQNVEVLAIGNQLNRAENDGVRAQTVTVAVLPEDASKLNLVSELGSFHLALRKPGDDRIVEPPQVRIGDLAWRSPESARPTPPAAPDRIVRERPASPRVVTVIRGGNVDRVVVER